MMVRALPFLLLAPLMVTGCSGPKIAAPSLLPRAAEAVDPRLPVVPVATPPLVDAALVDRLDALVAQARSGNGAFERAIGNAERLAAAAGGPQSESWILAQQALSAAAAARAATTRALGDVDALSGTRLERERVIAPADLAAIQQASRVIAAIDRAQHARIAAVSRRLGI